MPEELNSLLERIQKDGVEKAEAQAEAILTEARQKSDRLLQDARDEAQQLRKDAEREADAFQQRATKTLEQAARDVVLSVGQAVTAMFEMLAKENVAETLTPETLKELLLAVVRSYTDDRDGAPSVTLLLPEDKQQQVVELFMAEFQGRLPDGIDIRADDSVISGFRVAMVDDQLEHDFSAEAIADALCQLLRPRLAEIVKHALDE